MESAGRENYGNGGAVIGGPVQMAFLGCGLFVSLRLYKMFGMGGKLKALDWVLIGSAISYASMVVYGIIGAERLNTSPFTFTRTLTWPNDLLLSILLFEAIFLRRSAMDMGWGYVAKVWGAFAVAIFLTSLGSVLNWLTAYGYCQWMQTAFSWYLWYPVAAAFALGPAYQWEALKTAQVRMEESLEEEFARV